jgi:hypothetical protein
MSQLHVRNFLREIIRTARKIHTELGPDYKRKQYAGALAAGFSGGRWGCEQNVTLPSIIQSSHWKPDRPQPDFFKADFTFLNRNVLVRVVLYQWEIPLGVCRDLWQRMDATGVPLGLILNFGRPAFEYRRVMHSGYLGRLRAEWAQKRTPQRAQEAALS